VTSSEGVVVCHPFRSQSVTSLTTDVVCYHVGLMTVKDVQLLDDGTYVCHASNGVGDVLSSVVFVHVLSELQ